MDTEITPKQTLMEKLDYWKLAITEVTIKALIMLFTSIVASLNGAQWNEFTGTEKFVAIACAVVAMLGVVDSFLNQTISKIKTNGNGTKS